jgi:hypothetical protein
MSLILLICLSAPEANATGQVITGQIRAIATGWASEGLYFTTITDSISNDGCGPRYAIEANHPMIKTMTALLLTAQVTGAKVDIYVDGCFLSTFDMNVKGVAITK